jgi:hypothetical protein
MTKITAETTTGILRIAFLTLFSCLLALTASRFGLAQQPKAPARQLIVEPVVQIPTAANARPRWCYQENVPALAVFEGRSLVRYRLDGSKTKIVDFDRAPDARSLACSQDGGIILFLSATHDLLYLYANGELAVYTLDRKLFGFRFGSLLSPDGSTVALPAATHLARGSDLMQSKRIVRSETADVFWTREYVFSVRPSSKVISVESFSDLSSFREIPYQSVIGDTLIDGVFQCGTPPYLLMFSDERDNRQIRKLSQRDLKIDGAESAFAGAGREVGLISSNENACALSIAQVNANVSTAAQLILIVNGDRRTADMRSFHFASDEFALSNESQFLMTSQKSVPGGSTGNIVVLRLIEKPQR